MSRASSATRTLARIRTARRKTAPPPARNPALAAFIRARGANKQGPRTVAICYHLEEKQGVRPFTAPQVRLAYLSIPVRPPQNLPRLLKRLGEQGYLVRMDLRNAEYILSDSARSAFAQATLPIPEDPRQVLVTHLRGEVTAITDKDEREFLEEAIVCLSAGAFRAAVVMGWTAAMSNLRHKAAAVAFAAVNTEFSRRWPHSKKRSVKKPHDFEDFKDDEFLQVVEGMGIISRSVLGELLTHLRLRNNCGHPTPVRPRLNRVAAFFEDILQYALRAP